MTATRRRIMVGAAALSVCPSLLPAPAIAAEREPLRILLPLPRNENDPRAGWNPTLIRALLDCTVADFGPYRLDRTKTPMSWRRALEELERGDGITMYNRPYEPGFEKRFIVLPFPLMRGLLGLRIALIRADEQRRFDSVQSLDDLSRLTAGQGVDWPDVRILQASGLSVVTTNGYEHLFTMLSNGRFDYFPRGANEIRREVAAFSHLMAGLAVEQRLLLRYRYDNFLLVSRAFPAVAERLTEGFRRLIGTGELDRLFRGWFGADLRDLDLPGRRVLELPNPLIDGLGLDDPGLWLDLKTLSH
jgi:hypothetical protein